VLVERAEDLGSGEMMTNNFAEYRALIKGIRLAIHCGADEAHFVTDSQLVAQQVGAMWTVRSDALVEQHSVASTLIRRIDWWSISLVPRKLNERADWLCNTILRPEDKRALKKPPPPLFRASERVNAGWAMMGKKQAA
jgi:ribonuclease HI